jgi:hypothetical protein
MNKEQFIKAYCNKEEKRGDGFFIFRGFTMNQQRLESQVPPEYEYIESWSDGFRQVWKSDQLNSTITFCEGDVIVTHHERKASYFCELENAAKFYGETNQ